MPGMTSGVTLHMTTPAAHLTRRWTGEGWIRWKIGKWDLQDELGGGFARGGPVGRFCGFIRSSTVY
jgi:hypothetical protein